MTIQQLLWRGAQILNKAGVPDEALDARYLLMEAFHLNLASLLAVKNRELPEDEETLEMRRTYEELIRRRAGRIPLQHLTGVQEFMGFEFLVNGHVLIPRQDTETLVELVLGDRRGKDGAWGRDNAYNKKTDLNRDTALLDVCTGSGCIAISLALMGGYGRVTALDVSEEALAVAGRNADRLLEPYKGEFRLVHSNMFEGLGSEDRYDIIVSNPPYIPSLVIEELEPEVRDHEPRMALDGTEDGLKFYRILAAECKDHLNPGGSVYMEIGYDQGQAVKELFTDHGYGQVEVRKDMAGLDRVVRADWE